MLTMYFNVVLQMYYVYWAFVATHPFLVYFKIIFKDTHTIKRIKERTAGLNLCCSLFFRGHLLQQGVELFR